MSTKNVVIDLLNSLIDGVNDVTGKQDTNLTDGVNSLVEGFGQGDGGGSKELLKAEEMTF